MGRGARAQHRRQRHETCHCVIEGAAARADAGPEEILGALQASGSWGVVHEPSASGPFNAHDLDDTSPVLLDIDVFHAARYLSA